MARRRPGLADTLTIANGLCGLAVIVVALGHVAPGANRPGTLSHGRLLTCVALIVAGSICDVLDGLLAHVRGSSGLGEPLDLMCDLLTFGVAPAMLLLASAASDADPWRVLAFPVAAALVIVSMLRLARHASGQAPGDGGFYGLTMPGAAGAAIALVFLHPAPALEFSGVLVICALMVSRVPYPHQGRRMITLLSIYWCAVVAALAGALPMRLLALIWLLVVPLTPLVAIAVRRRADAHQLRVHSGATSGVRLSER
ncbi:MAG TPA: CDP-alcohol phosphatidyltransferase family protein [Solirubrobacteraceae bacterium]